MVQYGGLGGVWGSRPVNEEDAFEMAVERVLDLRDDKVAAELWGALVNQPWRRENGDVAAYSKRAAGDLVAAIRAIDGEDYVRWYMSAAAEEVTDRIAQALASEGWRPLTADEAQRFYGRGDDERSE